MNNMVKESKLTKVQAKKMLDDVASRYVQAKQNFDIWKKKESDLNKQMKTIMSTAEIHDWSEDGVSLNYSTRESVSWDEDAVLAFMHGHEKEFEGCIKTKEYVDIEVLEDLMYRNVIPKKLQTSIKKYMTTKIVEVLKMKKG